MFKELKKDVVVILSLNISIKFISDITISIPLSLKVILNLLIELVLYQE